jgi:hypothetical protein
MMLIPQLIIITITTNVKDAFKGSAKTITGALGCEFFLVISRGQNFLKRSLLCERILFKENPMGGLVAKVHC